MIRTLFVTAFALGTLTAGTALASEDHGCTAPMAEWQPREALQTKLEGEGWKVRRIKTEDGCYEAYAINDKGERVEAVFDPKTFQLVKMEDED
jgi:hypothetical protein